MLIPSTSSSPDCTVYANLAVDVPLPLYAACTVALPRASANCGSPVTLIATSKPISTSIRSPAPYVSPDAGLLVIDTAVTAGVVALPPSTL